MTSLRKAEKKSGKIAYGWRSSLKAKRQRRYGGNVARKDTGQVIF
jgi:hypothetical protein